MWTTLLTVSERIHPKYITFWNLNFGVAQCASGIRNLSHIKFSNPVLTARLMGAFHLAQNFRNFRFDGKRNTFRRFVPLENSQKKWKILKGGPVFPVGISERNFVSHLHVSRSLYQFQVHGKKICHGQLANQNGFPRALSWDLAQFAVRFVITFRRARRNEDYSSSCINAQFVFLLAPQWRHFCTTSALALD